MSDSSNSYENDTAAPSTSSKCSAPRSRESSTKKKHKDLPPAKHWSFIGIGMPPTKKHLKQTPPNAKHKKEARPKVIAPPKKAKKHKNVETIAAPPPHFEAPHPLQVGGLPSSYQTRASDAAAFAKWQASAAKAGASEETNMNEQEKSGVSSDSERYVTRKEFQHLERTFRKILDSWSQPTSDDVSEGKESGNGEEESKSRESSDSEGYVTRKEFKRWKDSFILFLDRLIETPAAASSTMHPARSMSVGQRMAIIGQLANPNRATRPFFCIPPPPKKLHHSKGLTPKCGKFGHPLAKDLS